MAFKRSWVRSPPSPPITKLYLYDTAWLFLYIWESNKEEALAEENSPVDCFGRRGNERKRGDRRVAPEIPTVSTKKKAIAKAIAFFSYIRASRELYCYEVIFGLRPSDIRFASFEGRYNIANINQRTVPCVTLKIYLST